jgi:phytoene synthase
VAGEDSAKLAASFLKEHDPDRYFSTLILREDVRAAVQALFAFSADVAAIPDRVSGPAPGEIRLQWWTDAFSGQGYGAVRQNPIADALLNTIDHFSLPTGPLQRLIAARRFDLYHDPMPDLPSFEGYAGETVSVLYQYAAMILNKGEPVEPGDAAGHLGVAHALIGHLRAFGYNASQGRIFLPLSVLAANGVTEGEILSGTSSEGLLAAHAQISDLAREHLDKADTAIRAIPRPLKSAFALTTILRAQLKKVEASSATPLTLPADIADWRKIAMLALWVWRHG